MKSMCYHEQGLKVTNPICVKAIALVAVLVPFFHLNIENHNINASLTSS